MLTDKLTAEDLAAMVRGANALITTMGKVFPGASPDELFYKLREVETSPVAQELLHLVLTQGKFKIG